MNDSPGGQPSAPYNDELNLRELIRVLWAGKWLIGIVTFSAAVLAIVVALMLPNVYRAEALLAPSDQGGAGGLSALASQYGGLASLAGIDLGGGKTDKVSLSLEILRSRKFISDFIDRHDILIPLMAADGWDASTGNLTIDSAMYDEASKKWVREVGFPRSTVPSSQEAFEAFREIFYVLQDPVTGFVTIAVEHYSPTMAKQWLDWLVEDLNALTMRRDVDDAERAIEYLNQQIEKTSIADLRKVFFGLIEEQTKTVMLATLTDEYVLKTIDPAVAPEEKTRPKRALIVVVAVLLSFFLSLAIVLIQRSRR
jgi:uncharacterized protein involved in exopolysaccharide biosynthesis